MLENKSKDGKEWDFEAPKGAMSMLKAVGKEIEAFNQERPLKKLKVDVVNHNGKSDKLSKLVNEIDRLGRLAHHALKTSIKSRVEIGQHILEAKKLCTGYASRGADCTTGFACNFKEFLKRIKMNENTARSHMVVAAYVAKHEKTFNGLGFDTETSWMGLVRLAKEWRKKIRLKKGVKERGKKPGEKGSKEPPTPKKDDKPKADPVPQAEAKPVETGRAQAPAQQAPLKQEQHPETHTELVCCGIRLKITCPDSWELDRKKSLWEDLFNVLRRYDY